jgi:hypothetical protein
MKDIIGKYKTYTLDEQGLKAYLWSHKAKPLADCHSLVVAHIRGLRTQAKDITDTLNKTPQGPQWQRYAKAIEDRRKLIDWLDQVRKALNQRIAQAQKPPRFRPVRKPSYLATETAAFNRHP